MAQGIPGGADEVLKLRRAVEASGEVIFMTDREGIFTYVNPAFVELYGHTPEEVVGRVTPRAIKGGQLSPAHYEEFWARLLRGETVQGEFVNRAKDGRLIEVEAAISPILDDGGRIVGFLSLQRDVTARRQTERLLRRWAEIFTNTAVGVAVGDGTDPDLSLVNPAFARMHGYTVDELTGAPIEQVYAPEARAHISRHLDLIERTGRASVETVHRRKDGTTFPVDLELNAVKDDQGRVLYRIATVIDVTKRQRGEAAARESETKYQTLYASMREAVALHELIYAEDGGAVDYRILDVNPAFEHHTGIPPARAVGALGSTLYGGAGAPYLDVYSRVVATGEATSFEAAFDPLGRIFHVSAFPTGPGRFATVFEDVTERRRLEEQFRQAQKMEAIGRLAGGIAHDFNNLLTAILGYSDLLLERELPEGVKADVEQIRKAGDAAAALTRQLLAFSRKQVLRPELIDLNQVVNDIDTMLRRVIGEDIRLVSIPAPRLARVAADPGQMHQVLLNLAVNARDAMPSGGSLIIETSNVTIGAALAGAPPPGDYVALVVSDTGTGISAGVQARLFEPFFTTKEQGKGTGLGLSTVYGIVKQSQGHIMVQSEEGRGTTFRILLPRADELPALVSTDAPRSLTKGTETVLVVEDQASVRALIEKVLRGLGYEVLVAAGAAEAMSLSAGHPGLIDLLLTDLLLGSMNGPELAQRLVDTRPTMAVLYISGYADHATMLGVLSSRVAFLRKPFTPEMLGQTVRQVLDRSVA